MLSTDIPESAVTAPLNVVTPEEFIVTLVVPAVSRSKLVCPRTIMSP